MKMTSDKVLLYDVDKLFKMALGNNYAEGSEKAMLKKCLRSLESIKIEFPKGGIGQNIETELSFVDLRIIDGFMKTTVVKMLRFLKEKGVIAEEGEVLRDLSDYALPDVGTFAGIVMDDPTVYFPEERIFYPKGAKRTHQALIKYPSKVRKAISEGKQFYMIGEDIIEMQVGSRRKRYKPNKDEVVKLQELRKQNKPLIIPRKLKGKPAKIIRTNYSPTLEEYAVFEDIFYLEHQHSKTKHYFGIWE